MTITLRSVKGTALTQSEVDGNFTDLNGRTSGFINIKHEDYGAAGDGSDATDAFETAIATLIARNSGGTIRVPAGTYLVSRSLRIHPNGPTSTLTRNITFLGEGDGNAAMPASRIEYVATSATDPSNYQNGLFDIASAVGINFEKLCLFNSASGINQIVWTRAEDANLLSCWKVGFKDVVFQNSAVSSSELTFGHLYCYNTLDLLVQHCQFFGSPINVTLGVDSTSTSGIASGFVSRANFLNNYFTGDIVNLRTNVLTLISNTFQEKWINPSPFMSSAALVMPDVSYGNQVSINVIGNEFTGLFGATSFTAGAIRSENNAKAVNITGNSFGAPYSKGIVVAKSTTGVRIDGNYLDLSDAGNAIGIQVSSDCTGSVRIYDNVRTAAMVADGGILVSDGRPYGYPYLVTRSASSDYAMTTSNTWETVLSTAPVSFPAGYYKVTAGALLEGGAVNANMGIRVSNTSSFTGSYEAMQTLHASGAVETVYLDETVYLQAAANVSWRLQARELNSSSGTVRALGIGNNPGTYIHVERLG